MTNSEEFAGYRLGSLGFDQVFGLKLANQFSLRVLCPSVVPFHPSNEGIGLIPHHFKGMTVPLLFPLLKH